MGNETKDLTGILELSEQITTGETPLETPETAATSIEAPQLTDTVPIVNDLGNDLSDFQTATVPLPATDNPLEQVKQYAEQMPTAKSPVPAEFPFSLLITGELAPEEKEKLLDILSRENMGIREVDLEPQFASHRILLPRISEYAGVLIVQALRATQAKMRLGPSDSVFCTPETREDAAEGLRISPKEATPYTKGSGRHPAEDIPITSDSSIPNLKHFVVLDVVTASMTLKTDVVEAENSQEYQETLEALQRELKYKAYHKGAKAILNYSVQLTQLHLPSNYRLMVLGTAIKAGSA